jgi:HlyD family secretion protein
MKFRYKALIVLAIVAAAGAAAYRPLRGYWKARNRPHYRLVEVTQGAIVSEVTATGEVRPVLRVEIGTVVSGPIVELSPEADFNKLVEKDQLLARIDPLRYNAAVARDKASLHAREADVSRVEAQLQQAKNDARRANDLYDENPDYISQTEMDQYRFNLASFEAQLLVAKASVEQAKANLKNSEVDLGYTYIKAPVAGMVIDRKIEPGQTLAASFQMPILFIIAPDMEKKMHVFASINETDVGKIRTAQQRGQPVSFTVDAYPNDLFEGTIEQIRLSSVMTQNVVTYPVVVAAPNPELKLLPGMTADLTFRIDKTDDVLMVPSSALSFYPPKPEMVRPEDRKILEGAAQYKEEDEEESTTETQLSATERVAAAKKRNRRHVWVVEGEFLKAVEIVTGLYDFHHSELVSGELKKGQKLVAGTKSKGP